MKKLTALVSILLLSGCYSAPDSLKPMPWIFKQMPEDAPNNYKLGWKDGCESGLSSMTNSFYKTFYSFKQNPNLRTDPTYYAAWQDTYDFCRHYAYGTLRQANLRMRLPNERPQILQTFMGTENIFEHGLLQLWGPGYALMPFENVGPIGGNLGDPIGMGGEWDYSGESALGHVNENPIMNWDFTK